MRPGAIEHGVSGHRDMDRRVLTVLLYQDLGGALDVRIGSHGPIENDRGIKLGLWMRRQMPWSIGTGIF